MTDRVFLTENRRDILNGESDLKEESLAVTKSRLRKRARMALAELIEVAKSDEIAAESIIEPDDLAQLIHACMMSPDRKFIPRHNYDGTDKEYREEYSYQIALEGRLSHTLEAYTNRLYPRDSETVPLLDPDNSE